MLSFDEALNRLLDAAQPPAARDSVPLTESAGRVLADDLVSRVDVPPLDNSAMDGYALRAADVPAPGTRLPVSQRIPAGQVGSPLQAGTAARIFTGAPVPPGADAVVMQENCQAEGDAVVINHAPRAGDNVRRAGEDIAQGGIILSAGTRLRPQEVSLAASAGLPVLPVYPRLRVGVFFTGDELHQPGEPLPPGGIYNSNRYGLRALLEGLGCLVDDLGTVPDTLEATRAALRRAATGNDLIITSGGVSVGEEDHVKPAVEAEGRLDLWSLAIKPGKPLAFGAVRKQEPAGEGRIEAFFVGLPGNPVSSMVTFMLVVRPFIQRLQGQREVTPRRYRLRADFAVKKAIPRLDFLRARINEEGGLTLFANQSSGVVTSLCWGDGLALNPPGNVIQSGDLIDFIPFGELLA